MKENDRSGDRIEQPRPGMEPHDLLFHGPDEPENECKGCGERFWTWQGARDHQEANCDPTAGIDVAAVDRERWIGDGEEFDWWVSGDRHTMELAEATDLVEGGEKVRLAEPIRGGPA